MKEPVNPKDRKAINKIPLHVCPDTVRIAGAMAFLEGDCKYGAYNYRVDEVRASTYKDAFERHWMAWWNGEDIDPDSGLPHLWKLLACITVIIDAQLVNKLVDDRPPKAPVGELMRLLEAKVKEIREQHADKNPRNYSINDYQEMPKLPETLVSAFTPKDPK